MRVSHGSSGLRQRHPAGFTLLEIVIVLALIGLLAAGGIGAMVLSSSKRALTNTAGTIEGMAKRARTISLLQQKPYALEFRPGKVRLLPFAEAGRTKDDSARENRERRSGGSRKTEEAPAPEANLTPVYQETSIDEDMTVMVKRWASDRWLPMDENHPIVWRFDPDGLCEPVIIHLGREDSWVEDEYHPLTAAVSDSSSVFK